MSKKPGGGWSAKSHMPPPAVAKHPHHAKPAGPRVRHLQHEVNKLQREVHALQHSGKHPHHTAKHHPHKGSKKHHRRGLALGDSVACCAAEALGSSLRLAEWPVGDADVLALYKLTADGPDAGASILATLEAAMAYGLAGLRPVSFEELALDDPAIGTEGVVLGVDLPGPHTVTVDAAGEQWLTWGERWQAAAFPAAVIEEAWAIIWP